MPSTSKAQHRFMGAASKGKVKGVKPSVGKEFLKADKGKMAHKPERKRDRKHRPKGK
jgi:hypothetical protein